MGADHGINTDTNVAILLVAILLVAKLLVVLAHKEEQHRGGEFQYIFLFFPSHPKIFWSSLVYKFEINFHQKLQSTAYENFALLSSKSSQAKLIWY